MQTNGTPFRRSHSDRVKAQAAADVERMVQSQTHALLDRILEPNIKGIVAHVVAGRQVSITLGFVNADGTPYQPPAPEVPAAVEVVPPVETSHAQRIIAFFRRASRREVARD